MKDFDYDAYYYNGEVYCVECIPDEVALSDEDLWPIFAGSEAPYPGEVCCVCGTLHSYMQLIKDDYSYR